VEQKQNVKNGNESDGNKEHIKTNVGFDFWTIFVSLLNTWTIGSNFDFLGAKSEKNHN
jgi:hypothetical protein